MTALATSGLAVTASAAAVQAPLAELHEVPIINPGFEEDLLADDEIPGWNLQFGVWEDQAYGVVDDTAHSGTQSLRIDDGNDVRGLTLESDPFPVEPDIIYEASAQALVERDRVGLYLRFYDAQGERLTNEVAWQQETDGEWDEVSISVASPEAAVTGTLVLSSSTAGLGVGYVDDVAIVATDESPEAPPVPVDPTDPESIEAQDERITHLGTPVSSRIITNMVLGEEDGVSMTYGVYRGNKDTDSPATLVVAETMTGDIVRALPMAGADHATEIRSSVDGKIYMMTTGTYSLWVYDPETTEVRNIGLINPDSPADGYGWSMAAAEDGRMYIGSYPKGLLYLYDPADDSITNLGRIDETQAYIRSLAYDLETGTLYVGSGGSSAQIWKVEPDGTKTPLLSEERTPGAQDHSFISTFTLVDGRLFARGGLSELLVIDTETNEVEYWKGDGKEAFGYQVTPRPDAPGKYIFTFQDTFWEYDAETATTRDLDIPNNGYLNDAFWIELDDPEWPGWTMVAATNDGVVKLNLELGKSEAAAIDYRNPIIIQKLLTGPDSLYASGYMVGLAPFGPEPGQFGETLQSGQFESSAVRDGKMLLGTYGHGRLMEYDPATGAAPREVFSLQAEDQDRPFGLDYDPVSDRAFMGTVAYYGHNQGALAVHDFGTGETTVYKEEIVEEQSVIDVLYHDGLVYLGTTIDGGLGGQPSGQTDAHFIVFDPDSGEVVHDIVPVSGDEGVTGLLVGPDGLIWGVSEDTVFKWDPEAEEIVYSEPLLGHRYGTNTVWAWAYLAVGADGNVYGTNRYSFFKIDAETMEYTRIVDRAGNYLNVDDDGDVYFSSSVHLFKYDVPEPGGEPVAVTPGEVVFADEPGTEDDSYTIPAVDGVEYVVGEEVVTAGTYPGSGTVTVSARALEGYVLAEGATAQWSHTFATDGGEGPEVPEQPAQRYGFFLTNGWSGGDADYAFQYGRHTDEVLIGDWDGDGKDSITVRRGDRYFVNNAPKGGPASSVFTYGRANDVVLVGDWNGDGTDTLAVRRGAQYHVKNSLRDGDADQVIFYGRAADDVMVGDWNGNGHDTFAVRRGATYHVKNSMRGGDADRVFTYGRADDEVLAGDWDGDGRDTFTVRRGKAYHVNNSLRGGEPDIVMLYGKAEDDVYVGDWNGDGRDTIGVRRTP